MDTNQSLYSPSYTHIAPQQIPTLTPYSYVPLTPTVTQVPIQTHGYHSAPLTLHVTGAGGIDPEPAQYAELQPRPPSPANMYAPKLAVQQTTSSTPTNIAKPPKPRAPRSPRSKKAKTNGETPAPSIAAPAVTSQPAAVHPIPNNSSSMPKPIAKQVLTSSNTHIVIQTAGSNSQPIAPAAVTTMGNTTVALRTSTSNYRCMGCGKTYPIGQSVDARGEYCSPFCQQNPKPPPPLSPGKRRGRPPRSGPPQPKTGKPSKPPASTANNATVPRVTPPAAGPHPVSRPGARIAKSVTNLSWNIDEYISKQNAIEASEALFPHVIIVYVIYT